jgi:Zn-finger nucleic acid-binding protein
MSDIGPPPPDDLLPPPPVTFKDQRLCPVCGEPMAEERRHDVKIDVCPQHGLWLDTGELPAIIQKVHQQERVFRDAAQRRARWEAARRSGPLGWIELLFDLL